MHTHKMRHIRNRVYRIAGLLPGNGLVFDLTFGGYVPVTVLSPNSEYNDIEVVGKSAETKEIDRSGNVYPTAIYFVGLADYVGNDQVDRYLS